MLLVSSSSMLSRGRKASTLSKLLLAAAIGAPLSLFAAPRASAVILADQWWRNKSAPSGSLAGSGWQWTGDWGAFTGIPIARNYFITASHVGGSVGQSLTLNGHSYRTTAMFDDPNSDLRIWKTSSSFSSWAPLYTANGEVNKTAVIIGRGTARGSDLDYNGWLHGWSWGAQDGRLSWGRNKLKSNSVFGGSGIGSMLSYTFDRSGHGDHVSDEGITSAGDSSGGVFVNSFGTWKLAGINYSVDGPFHKAGESSSYLASLFDMGGFYKNGSYISNTSSDIPQAAYATRISSNQNWIRSVIGNSAAAQLADPSSSLVPEPTTAALLLGGGLGALALRRRRRGRRFGRARS